MKEPDASDDPIEWYVGLLQQIAVRKGKTLRPMIGAQLERRFTVRDADLVRRGFEQGLLRLDARDYLRTRDPYQATAWLIESDPAWPCWEYLPHAAAYVELIDELGFPAHLVRFETPGSEGGLDADLAVVDPQGSVRILGEVKKESAELDRLEVQLSEFLHEDPGPPIAKSTRKAAQKLAHRLWLTRAPWLWLTGPADRRSYRVTHGPLRLDRVASLPTPLELGLAGVTLADVPRIRLPGPRASPSCLPD